MTSTGAIIMPARWRKQPPRPCAPAPILPAASEYATLIEAVQKGYIREDEIDRAVRAPVRSAISARHVRSARPSSVLTARHGSSRLAEHQQLALEAAEKSIVLLKNNNQLLPLVRVPKKIAVVGPASDDPDVLLGNYYGTPRHFITPLAGIKKNSAPGQMSSGRWAAFMPNRPWRSFQRECMPNISRTTDFAGKAGAVPHRAPRLFHMGACTIRKSIKFTKSQFRFALASDARSESRRRLPAWPGPPGMRQLSRNEHLALVFR